MAIEITTIPKVYLKDKSLWRSAYHTAIASSTGTLAVPGQPEAVVTLTFLYGLAKDVPVTLYRIFADAGIATTDMPRIESPWGGLR